VSKAYNWFLREAFSDGVQDHQCGLKMFSKRAIQQILPQSRENSWFWDTEVIVLAKKLGLKVVEVPVDWVEEKYTHTPFKRLLSDVWVHGTGIIRLKGNIGRIKPST
jgi:hypothetical protein